MDSTGRGGGARWILLVVDVGSDGYYTVRGGGA